MIKRQVDGKYPATWDRFSFWISRHQAMVRLLGLTIGLVAFLFVLPAYWRNVIWDGLQSNEILAGMLLIFTLLAISLVWSTGQKVDAWAFLLLNVRGKRPVWLDWIMSGFTQIGSAFGALGMALIFYLTGNRLLPYEIVLGTLTLWLCVEFLKFFIHRSRPHIRLVETRIIGYRARGRSFPSGHTSQVFFLSTLLAQHFQASIWVVILLYVTAFMVGVTRIYVGAHYPRDVLAGAILGSVWGLLGGMVDRYMVMGGG